LGFAFNRGIVTFNLKEKGRLEPATGRTPPLAAKCPET